jgi:hypothetical protein
MNFTFCSARQPPRWSRSCSSPRHNRRRVSQRRTGRPHAYVHETNHFSLHIRLVFEPRGARSHQHRYVARGHHWNQRSGGIHKFDFHTGPRDAQFRNTHRRSLRIWRQPAGSVRGRTRGVSVRFRAIQCRPSAFGRRAGSSNAGQYPQRLGFDAVFRAAADERKFASLTPAEPNRALLPRLCCASAPWRASSRRRAP